jgi:hypothetical protein
MDKLDGWSGIESQQNRQQKHKTFQNSTTSVPDLGPIKWLQVPLTNGANLPRREADYSHPLNADVKIDGL